MSTEEQESSAPGTAGSERCRTANNQAGRAMPDVREEDQTGAELLAIFGACSEVVLKDRRLIIKPLTLRDLPEFLRWYALWRRGEAVTEQADAATGEAEVRVLEMLTGEDYGSLCELSDDELHLVLQAAFAANPTLFDLTGKRRPTRAAPGGKKGRRSSIQVSIAQLIEAGHSLADIEGYTLQQMDVLCQAHARLAAERQINAMVAARAAQVETNVFRGIVRDLEQAAQAPKR